MGCCISQLACCCGPASCGLCCSSLPALNESSSTRMMYTLFLSAGFIIQCLMLVPEFHRFLTDEIPSFNSTCVRLYAGENCERVVGYRAVYRLSVGLVGFFAIMMVLTPCIPSSNHWRGSIQNGYWGVKLTALCFLSVASFFIPDSFSIYWMFCGLVSGFIFIILQLLLLVDFTYAWNATWIGRRYGRRNIKGYIGTVVSSVLFYAACVVGLVFLLIHYAASEKCKANRVFLAVNTTLCVTFSLITILPAFSKRNPNASLLQSSVISLYVVYLTWSAMTSEPLEDVENIFSTLETRAILSPGSKRDSSMTPLPTHDKTFEPSPPVSHDEVVGGESVNSSSHHCRPGSSLPHASLVSAYAGLLITFFMAVYASLLTSHDAHKLGIWHKDGRTWFCCVIKNRDNPSLMGGQRVIYNEADKVTYQYWFFHLLFILTAFYIMMQLTNWYRPAESNLNQFGLNWPAVWVKMASSWTCVIIYIWTLFQPRLCFGRNLSFTHKPVVVDGNEMEDGVDHDGSDTESPARSSFPSQNAPTNSPFTDMNQSCDINASA